MVSRGRLVFPGLRFGKVFIGPQPPRGWEVDEELLHANTSITPPHQYLAFYQWLRDDFAADVLVHVGRHSTEFCPAGRGPGGGRLPQLDRRRFAQRVSVYCRWWAKARRPNGAARR